jgi:hypothetical protein
MEQLASVFQSLWQIVLDILALAVQLLVLGLHWSLLIAWVAWWLCGVNWSKAWPVLARGAWAPVVLLLLISALVWSRIAPSECACLGFVTVPNFWWQLGAVGLLASITLFCGWLQGIFQWAPPEISLDPPVHADHGHAHGEHH